MKKKASLVSSVHDSVVVSRQISHDRELQRAKHEAKSWKDKYEHVSNELNLSEKRIAFIAEMEHDVAADKLVRLKPSGEATAVLVLSDWHIEETIDPETINGLNAYSLQIAAKRVNKMFERALMMIDVARGLSRIDTLVVAALGDFITGYIHEELEENNSLSPSEAVLMAFDLLIQGIRFLKREGKFKSVLVPTAVGNHGRSTKKPRISSAYANSFEWLMYQLAARAMSGDAGIVWKVEKGYHNWVNVQGFDVRFHHGDSFKYQGGVGGITIPVAKGLAQWNKVRRADYDYFGHFHTSFNTNTWCCNGSVIGYSPYALAIKAECEVPSQTLSIISKKRGKILTDRIFCD